MNAREMIDVANQCTCILSVAAEPGCVYINITKKEARHLIEAHNLLAHDVMGTIGHVSFNERTCNAFLHFHT
jgi:hypothetical protein